jgi:hypothetical protein
MPGTVRRRGRAAVAAPIRYHPRQHSCNRGEVMEPTPRDGPVQRLLRDPRQRLAADVLLALLVCWTAARIYLSHYGVGNALSSDNVMPYVMFDDLFHRGVGLAGFLWPESPFYFPDTALAWLIYAVSGSLLGAVMAYAWINAMLFVLLVRAVLSRAAPGPHEYARAAWLAFLGLWLLVGALGAGSGSGWFGQFYAYVFVPNNHSGTLIGVLCGFALLLGDKSRAGPASIALLALLSVALLVSDRLYEIQFIVPAIAYCAYRWFAAKTRWHVWAFLTLLALLIGAEALRWLFPSDTMRWVAALAGAEQGFQVGGDPTMRVSAGESLARMMSGFAGIFRADPLTSIIELAAVLASAWIIVAAFRVRDRTEGAAVRNRALLAALIVASIAAPLLASIVLGRHIAVHAFRYCQTIVLLLVPLSMLVAAAFRRRPAFAWTAYGAVAIAALLLPVLIDASRSALRANERDQEQCLRSLAANRNLKFGVAEFWHALEMTARFPTAPVVAPLSTDAGPRMSMVTNMGWFGALAERPEDIPTLDFVDEYSYPPELLDAAFGKPAERAACPRSNYRIYRPQDGALAHLYRYFEWMPGQILQRLGAVALPAAAWAADDAFVDGDAIHASGPLAPSTPLLITAQDFPPGALRIWLAYSLVARAPGAAARWDVSALDASGNAAASVGKGVLDAAADVARIDLPLQARPDELPGLGISVTASGDVDLRIVAIGLRVDRNK